MTAPAVGSEYLAKKPGSQPVAMSVESHSSPLAPSERAMLAMRWPTSTMRATFSARST